MKTLGNFIDGAWRLPSDFERLGVEDPSTGRRVGSVVLSTQREVHEAVLAAKKAFPSWSRTPVSSRVEPLIRLAARIREEEETLSRLLTLEMGKSLPDARAEIKRTFQNVEAACAMPLLQQGDKLVGASGDIDGEVLKVPIGVFGMIAPFNFPAMVPFWFIPYALATGNTYVCKPSEVVPMTMAALTDLMNECGIPPGVFNLVNGGARVGQALIEHPDVAGISFVGSTAVGREVASECARHGKRYQVLAGAKNHLVVMPDAHLDHVVRNMITSCFGCAGQRCMTASAIVAVGEETHQAVVSRFVSAASELIVASPLDEAVADEGIVMGPVISAQAHERIVDVVNEAEKEGATVALDGRNFAMEGYENGNFMGPTVLTDVVPGSLAHRTEIFGPVVVILKAGTFDEALEIIASSPYGNGASIYTQNGYFARRFKLEVTAGMVGINVGIPAPVAYLPFGGMKASLFADVKAQGKDVVNFFTQSKVVTERYWPEEG